MVVSDGTGHETFQAECWPWLIYDSQDQRLTLQIPDSPGLTSALVHFGQSRPKAGIGTCKAVKSRNWLWKIKDIQGPMLALAHLAHARTGTTKSRRWHM